MSAGGEQATAAGITDPDPETALTGGGAATAAPGRRPWWVVGDPVRLAVRPALRAQPLPVHHPPVRAGRRRRQLDPDRAGQALHPAHRQLLTRGLQPSRARLHVRAGLRRVPVPERAARGADRVERAHALGVRPGLRVRRAGRRGRLRVDAVAAGRRGLLRRLHRLRDRLPADRELRLDAVHVRADVHGVHPRGRIGGGRAGAGRLDLRADRLVPHPRARLLPVLRAGDHGSRARRGRCGRVPARAPRRRSARSSASSAGPGFRSRSSARCSRLPIVVNLVLHWPGDFGKYISYGGSGQAGGHGLRQVVDYALWFWWPHQHAWLGLAPLLGYRGRARRHPAGSPAGRCAGSCSRCSPSTWSRRWRSVSTPRSGSTT